MLFLFSFAPPQLWLQIVLFIFGVIMVLWGADKLTEGAVGLAERMGISQVVIGLTIVAMGTSMPEFFVSLMSSVHGTPDLAVGNVTGSNIFNVLLIVGCAALVSPIVVERDTVFREIPYTLIASVALLIMCVDSEISRWDALILTVMFMMFMYKTLRGALRDKNAPVPASSSAPVAQLSVAKAVGLLVLGFVCLVLGSNIFVDNASAIAKTLGMSDALIGLTIVAGGTSLPELATSVVAAARGRSGIAMGNVIGSNVFNILMILGITGLIAPMQITDISMVDLSVMVISVMVLWFFAYSKYKVERWEGAVLVLSFVGYMTFLVMQALGR